VASSPVAPTFRCLEVIGMQCEPWFYEKQDFHLVFTTLQTVNAADCLSPSLLDS
jgi:hypothetical protein